MNTNQIQAFTKIDADGVIEYDFAASSMAENRQFLYQLVRLINPRVIVELGTYYGCSYFAMAQAIKDFKLKTRLIGIDTWRGDTHAGHYDLSVHFDFAKCLKEYPHNCSYKKTSFEEAVSDFANASIDLLLIDGEHTYEAVKRDFNNYLPKLSDNGIVLFHDTRVGKFGVGRVLEELKASGKYEVFNFKNEFGLGVVVHKGAKIWQTIAPLLVDHGVAIYSAVYGGKDNLPMAFMQSKPTDFICFTDVSKGGRYKRWALVIKESKEDPRLAAKRFKVEPYNYSILNDYRYLIWVDGHVEIKHPDFTKFMIKQLDNKAVAFFRHPHRSTVMSEIGECISQGKLTDYKHASMILEDNADITDDLLLAGTVIIYDMHHPKVRVLGKSWMAAIEEYTIRDQVSLPFVLRRNNIPYATINMDIYNNPYFNYGRHLK